MRQRNTQENPRAFFGRRAGKPLSAPQVKLMNDRLPQLAVDLTAPTPQSLASLFHHQPREICLEIGFGGGEHLVHRASENPSMGFIGAEPFRNGMVKALGAVEERELTNIRFHYEEAGPLLDWLPEASCDLVYLLYPDPWHKSRHNKRRFVSTQNVNRIARVLKTGGEFRFASDIDGYVDWTLNHITQNVAFVKTTQDPTKPWQGWPSTRYEAKARREGRSSAYYTFKRG